MKKQYKVTLLTDVIINQKAATEGTQSTLDFIPGNSFLGIVASIYNELNDVDQITVFHSGKIKFGDAHPCHILPNGSITRSIRIPSTMYYPKLKNVREECYIHHFYNRDKDDQKQQLKQCRNGFYTVENNTLCEVQLDKNFVIKSAYDRQKRRSKDEMMYGYQSIEKGATFSFEIDFESSIESTLIDKINKAILGRKRIGRSSTAQYGLVTIEPTTYTTIPSTSSLCEIEGEKYCTIYAESRLIFLDQYGLCTLTPTAKDLGIPNGTIDWNKSQVRSFQYAPWNNCRQARDTDRCGIEKGSVFIVKTNALPSNLPAHIGVYKNEGFGSIIYNPAFLAATPSTNGLALFKITDRTHCNVVDLNVASQASTSFDSLLLNKLRDCKQDELDLQYQYRIVDEFISNNISRYRKDIKASQWGTIRAIAMQANSKQELHDALFKDKKGYLVHGIAKESWAEKGRVKTLETFILEIKNEKLACSTIINLAAEMAKRAN
ncbi:MAG: hypothetical protein ACRDCN_12205 [Tannerellaceae bacterium]